MRVIVLGSGWSGLLAVAAAAPHVDEVVMVDRDNFRDDERAVRAGTPQAHHVHGLKFRGYRWLGRRFPEFWERIAANGGAIVTTGEVASYVDGFGWLTRPTAHPPVDRKLVVCSRGMLEKELRSRVLDSFGAKVSVRTGTRIVDLVGGRDRIEGVRVETSQGRETLSGDLVINALGRTFDGAALLNDVGCSSPPVLDYNPSCFYITQKFNVDASATDIPGFTRLDYSLEASDSRFRFVLAILRQENNSYIVTLSLYGVEERHKSLVELLSSLRLEIVDHFLSVATPVGPVHRMGKFVNRLVRYDQWLRPPSGYAAIGDQICTTNPTAGFGMTVATIMADALEESLRRRSDRYEPGGYFRAAVEGVLPIWRYVLADEVQRRERGADASVPASYVGLTQSAVRAVRRAAVVSRPFGGILTGIIDGGWPTLPVLTAATPLAALTSLVAPRSDATSV